MNNASVVGVLKRSQYLNGKVYRILPLKDALELYLVCKRNSVYIFHNNKLNLLAEAYIINLDDIRMR